MRLIKNKPIDIGEVLDDAKPIGIIHAGAHLAEELPLYQERGIDNRCWIEADPVIFQKLIQILPQRDVALNMAVCDEDKILEFYLMDNGQSSSLLVPTLHLNRYPDIKQSGTIKVFGRKFDTLINEGFINLSQYDFLYMDLQGAEFKALLGFEEYIKNIKYIMSEVNYEELYSGCTLIDKFDAYLANFGFVKQWATIHEAVGWGDAYYKRIKDGI